MSDRIPKSWRKTTFGEILIQRTQKASGHEELLSVTASRGVIRQDEVGRRDSSSDDKTNYRKIEPGDIAYNTMRMWQGVSGVSRFSGIASPAYTVCIPTSDVDSRFLGYLLKHPSYVQKFYRASQGLVSDTWNLKYSSFKEISVTIPPILEQLRIAEILDAVDDQIQKSINIVDKLNVQMFGLQESLLNQVSTPPEPLSAFLAGSPKNGYSPKEVEEWTGLFALGLGCLTSHGFEPKQLKNVPNNNPRNAAAMLNHGDLLMSRANTRELVGLAGRYSDIGTPCIYPDLMMRLTPNSRCSADFLEVVLRSSRSRRQIQAIAQGTSESMVKINAQEVSRLTVRVPEPSEQGRILSSLAEIRYRITEERRVLTKLSLLKQGLMDDLLTGRVRVRIQQD